MQQWDDTFAKSARIQLLETGRVGTLGSVDDGQQVPVVSDQPSQTAVAFKRICSGPPKNRKIKLMNV